MTKIFHNYDLLDKIQSNLESFGINGYIIPSTDEFQNEEVADYAKRLEVVTGFSGSNGIAIITKGIVYLYTDGRYLEQAKRQLDLARFIVCELRDLYQAIDIGKIGYDGRLFTQVQLKRLSAIDLVAIDGNIVDKYWLAKPDMPKSDVYEYEVKYAGDDASSKIKKIRHNISADEYILLTKSDSICWLLNIRAQDLNFSPVLLSYMVIGVDIIKLYVNWSKTFDIPVHLKKLNIQVDNINDICVQLESLGGRIFYDQNTCPSALVNNLVDGVIKQDPCILDKSIKSDKEIENFLLTHKKDAVALWEGINWIYEMYEKKADFTEYDIGLKLTQYRKVQKGYICDSFPAIVGFKENGAIIHYRASQSTAKPIKGNGLLLIDSGGHYFGGTTDVTRTLALGNVSAEQKKFYTLVLKGHLALEMQLFKNGISGANIDILARKYLWQEGEDYAHGTGHGVGNALFVHEGPQSISSINNMPLKRNMVVSNEPGYYVNGEYGIRIENLAYVKKERELYFKLATLTMVPYCIDLIDFSILDNSEKDHISNYHKKIYSLIASNLGDDARKRLEKYMF